MDKAPGSIEALIGDAGGELGMALAAIGVATSIIGGLLDDQRTDVTAEGWMHAGRLLRELPDLGKLHELRRLCAVLSGDYVPGADGGQMRAGDFSGDDLPDVKVWSRKLSTGVRTYRWVLAGDLEAYRAEVDADPDRELIDGYADGGEG